MQIDFLFNDAAPTEIYTLSLHDALPICREDRPRGRRADGGDRDAAIPLRGLAPEARRRRGRRGDRKSTRLNSSHGYISYAVFCLKKKKPFKLQAFHSGTRRLSHPTTLTA